MVITLACYHANAHSQESVTKHEPVDINTDPHLAFVILAHSDCKYFLAIVTHNLKKLLSGIYVLVGCFTLAVSLSSLIH